MRGVARVAERRTSITGLEVSGFKSAIKPVRISLLNLTILAGQNSAGKSTIMQPVIMCKQTLEMPFDPGSLAIDGPIVQFTNADQFFSKAGANSGKEFSLKVEFGDDFVKMVYKKERGGSISLKAMSFTDIEVSRASDGKAAGRLNTRKILEWFEGQIIEEDSDNISAELKSLVPLMKDSPFRASSFVIGRDRCILSASMNLKNGNSKNSFNLSASPAHSVMSEIRNIIYLPGLRGNPERNYRITTSTQEYPGNFNDYVASIISNWQHTRDIRLATLGANLKTLGLTWKVETKKVDDIRAEILVGRLPAATQGGAHDTVNIADVGFGVSQTLPVLVALLTAITGQYVFIEQPEIHLHPKAQVALAEVFLAAVKRGVKVIVETHSSLLVLAFQALIAGNSLEPEQVSLNWFTRDDKGQTIVTQAVLGKDGSYGDWPVDFGTVELKLQDHYMDLADKQHVESGFAA